MYSSISKMFKVYKLKSQIKIIFNNLNRFFNLKKPYLTLCFVDILSQFNV